MFPQEPHREAVMKLLQRTVPHTGHCLQLTASVRRGCNRSSSFAGSHLSSFSHIPLQPANGLLQIIVAPTIIHGTDPPLPGGMMMAA